MAHRAGPSIHRRPADRYRADRLRLRHLRLLETIHRSRSLRRAAEEVGVSQPAASLLLREIEAVFGTPLVIRTAKGCHLSDAGMHALDRLAISLSLVDRAIQTARAPRREPLIRVGAVQLAGTTVLPDTLARLERQRQSVRIHISEGRASELLRDLTTGHLDCVIGWVDNATIGPLPIDTLRLRTLWQGRMEVIAAVKHPLSSRRLVSLDDLQDQRWVVAEEGTRMHAAFVRLFAQSEKPAPAPFVDCSAVHTTVSLVSRTNLLAVVPDVVAASAVTQRQVKVLRGNDFEIESSSVSLITRRDTDSLGVLRKFRDALLESVATRK